MKTVTLKIHGRDIEFTDQPPTRAGAYWWTFDIHHLPQAVCVIAVGSNLYTTSGPYLHKTIAECGGLWSAPLVPVTEVGNAHREGWHDRANGNFDHESHAWENSRARRVVEGLE